MVSTIFTAQKAVDSNSMWKLKNAFVKNFNFMLVWTDQITNDVTKKAEFWKG